MKRKKSQPYPTMPFKMMMQNKTTAPKRGAITDDRGKNIQILSVMAVGSNSAIVIKPII